MQSGYKINYTYILHFKCILIKKEMIEKLHEYEKYYHS